MQATVRSFDPASRRGSVILDDGVELAFEPQALEGSGVRHLRSGQRVRMVLGAGPDDASTRRVVALTVITLP